MQESNHKYDVIIIGGGMVGMTLALALARADISSAIIESEDPKRFDDTLFDGRVSALSLASKNIFTNLGIWDSMSRNAGKIDDIRVVDGNSPLFVHYDHKDVGDAPMGYIIENRFTRRALLDSIVKNKFIEYIAPASSEEIKTNSDGASIRLDDGREISAKLLVSAEGRKSKIRAQFNIKTIDVDYKQVGIVCTIRHEKPHEYTAIERFLPAGPFAILPMKDIHHSSLVWTEKSHLAPIYMAMNDSDFLCEIEKRFDGYLGKISLVGSRFSYPLTLSFAEKYTGERMALAGDAAHGIHPISGQGLNLGLRDVAVLSEIVSETKALGLDIGGANVLSRYEKHCRFNNMQMIIATDGLNRLFSNNIFPIKLARRIGLGIVNKIPPLKKRFMKHAMGITGDLPELIKKESAP